MSKTLLPLAFVICFLIAITPTIVLGSYSLRPDSMEFGLGASSAKILSIDGGVMEHCYSKKYPCGDGIRFSLEIPASVTIQSTISLRYKDCAFFEQEHTYGSIAYQTFSCSPAIIPSGTGVEVPPFGGICYTMGNEGNGPTFFLYNTNGERVAVKPISVSKTDCGYTGNNSFSQTNWSTWKKFSITVKLEPGTYWLALTDYAENEGGFYANGFYCIAGLVAEWEDELSVKAVAMATPSVVFENQSLECGESLTLVSSCVSGATPAYSIVSGGDMISLSGNTLTAASDASGTATVMVNYPATKDYAAASATATITITCPYGLGGIKGVASPAAGYKVWFSESKAAQKSVELNP